MSVLLILCLLLGVFLVLFGIITFYGKTSLSKKHYRIFGIEVDASVIAIALFMLGMIGIIIFLIEVMGPRFVEEGL